jgi:phosphoserine phosphatase RsbU/P
VQDGTTGSPPALAASVADPARLAAVARYEVLDTPPDGAFDRIAALASRWFATPIATVSIVDADRVWFKATHGLDGVAQIGTEPGLCASAVLQAGPYVIEDALHDPRTVDNPLVHGEPGIRFYAAAPIVTADGHRLGTVNVLDVVPREATEAGLATLRDLADLVMDQLELRLSALQRIRRERELRREADLGRADVELFAATLQRTLLPPELPSIEGLELACHYHTASVRDVGGDFYDVFALPDGRWAFFLGDVCGHGASAAALTSLMRYSLRAVAIHDPDPHQVLDQLNNALLNEPTDHKQVATVVFGIIEPDDDGTGDFVVTLASGGHEPALHLRAPSVSAQAPPVELVTATAGGMLMGAVVSPRIRSGCVRLRAGDALLLYTDGLTEARIDGAPVDPEGLLRWFAPGAPEGDGVRSTSAEAVVEAARTLITRVRPAPRDDIALLAIGVPARRGA